jgi:hypothetical protein
MLGDSFNLTILGVILGMLATGVVASLIAGKKSAD